MTKNRNVEIERKFLVRASNWEALAPGIAYRQGYLSTDPDRVVRVRLEGDRARLTIKGKPIEGGRPEYEYSIPLDDARFMLDHLCRQPLIEKTRHRIPFAGHIWEVDRFGGRNTGLVVAEIELGSTDEKFELPPWVAEEVTDDPRYLNSSLVTKPYQDWPTTESGGKAVTPPNDPNLSYGVSSNFGDVGKDPL